MSVTSLGYNSRCLYSVWQLDLKEMMSYFGEINIYYSTLANRQTHQTKLFKWNNLQQRATIKCIRRKCKDDIHYFRECFVIKRFSVSVAVALALHCTLTEWWMCMAHIHIATIACIPFHFILFYFVSRFIKCVRCQRVLAVHCALCSAQ